MKAKCLIAFLLVCCLGLTALALPAQADEAVVDIYFYHSKTCPHCLKQKPLMEYIDGQNQAVKLHAYEVHENPQAWQDFLEKHQLPTGAVPRTAIADKIFVGYTEEEGELEYIPVHKSYLGYRNQIVKAIEEGVGHSIKLPGKNVNDSQHPPWKILLVSIIYGLTYPLVKIKLKTDGAKRYWLGGLGATLIITLFAFLSLTPDTLIKRFAQTLPFPWFVATIALAAYQFLADSLVTPLQIEQYLSLAFEAAYGVATKPVTKEILQGVLAQGLDDLEPRLLSRRSRGASAFGSADLNPDLIRQVMASPE
jgi:hypothetical protein